MRIKLAANLNQLDYVKIIINNRLKIPLDAGGIIKSLK